MDDAGVVRVREDLALVQTVDIFPPVVDDPYWYGRIAAANSLSDVYAMGATPVAAVNFVGYPLGDLGAEILARILEGSFDALREADCVMAGGHSVQDPEIKFGLAVVGTVHPDRVVKNCGAKPGDRLVLTKALGMGCLTTALKQGAAEPAHVEAGQKTMARLNRDAAEAMLRIGVNAATDITGFGLLGHACEMAEGSGVSIRIHAKDVPVLEEARPYVDEKFTCGGSKRNRAYADGRVQISADVAEYHRVVLHGVQTSGGLLISVPADRCEKLLSELHENGDAQAAAIGDIVSEGPPIVVS